MNTFQENNTREIIQSTTNLVLLNLLEDGKEDGLWTFEAHAPVHPFFVTVEVVETDRKLTVQINELLMAPYTIKKKAKEVHA